MIKRQDFIKERNRILKKAIARTHRFLDNGKNYYWYRLQELDKLEKNGGVEKGNMYEQ